MKRLLAALWVLLLVLTVLAQSNSKTKKISVSGLIFDLKHPDADRRAEAARLLGDNKVREAVEPLMNASEDKEKLVRMNCLTALDAICDMRAAPTFTRLTADEEKDIRRKAIDALVRVYILPETGFVAGARRVFTAINPFDSSQDESVVESYVTIPDATRLALEERMGDVDRGVRRSAIAALGSLRCHASVAKMRAALAGENDDAIIVTTLWSFYKIGDPSVCASLHPFLQNPSKDVHDQAILVAGLLRCRDAVETLTELYESNIKEKRKVLKIVPASGGSALQKKCLQSLSMMGDPTSSRLFLPALNHKDDDYRIAAAEGLARIGDPQHVDAVAPILPQTKSQRFQAAIRFALYSMGQKEQLVPIVKELDSGRSDQVFGYLLEIKPQNRPALYPLLRSHHGKIRIRLLELLGLIGEMNDLPEVERFTSDSDADTASAALHAVRRIRGRSEKSPQADTTPAKE